MTPQERKDFEAIRDNVHGEQMTAEEQRIYDAGYTNGFMDCSKKLYEQSTEQEPAFYAHDGYLMTPERAKFLGFPLDSILALYTSPPQSQETTRKPLTDEEIRQKDHHMVEGAYHNSFKQGVRWAEYKHGIGEKE